MSITEGDAPRPVISVAGAYEDFEGKREHLTTLTRNGRLLQVGDKISESTGKIYKPEPLFIILPPQGVRMLNIVNELGTPTCDDCTRQVEKIQKDHPEIRVVSVYKHSPTAKSQLEDETEGEITHLRASIDHETAINLGVAFEPGENADPEFWPGALRRSLIVIDQTGTIAYIDQPDDQEQKPDFDAALKAATNLLAK